jgi:hypothetical protein
MLRVELFYMYKTDMGYYIPLESEAFDWFNGVLCQHDNPKLDGWVEFKLTGDKIRQQWYQFGREETIKGLFSLR